MKISYNWLKSYVPELPDTQKLWDVFTFHLCEVESMEKLSGGDTVFDINILPNRARDLLSHQGIAQEISALCDIHYSDPTSMYKIPKSKETELKVEVQSKKCRRYMGRIVRNVTVGPSPDWMVQHLNSIGQKSINNLVDATNIVMFDCGNPTHVFDESKVIGKRLKIAEIQEPQKIRLLGNEEKELREMDLVIADDKDNIVAIAGVKGSTYAEVDHNTKDIILEVANFDPVATRKTGRRLSLFTDALKRFENDLSPVRAQYAMRELSALILEICPDAEFEDIIDVFPDQVRWETIRTIEVSVEYINEKLGSVLSVDDIEDVWKRMKFDFEKKQSTFIIRIPLLRLDIVDKSDLIEEVGRIVGYNTLIAQLPQIEFTPLVNETEYYILAAKNKLQNAGYKEVMTYSFTKKGIREISHGAKGKEALRTNITDALKEAYTLNKLNAPLLGQEEIKIFEIGNVFIENDTEELHVAWADRHQVQETTLTEYTTGISIDSSYASFFSDETKKTKIFEPWSVFPCIVRDISFWLPDGVDRASISEVLEKNKHDLIVRGPDMVDTFVKDGKTSVAYRFVFQSSERTLTDKEVEVVIDSITKKLISYGCEIR